jgi:hypothetical protein
MTARWLRSTLVAVAATAVVVFAHPAPARAHGAVDVTVHSDGTGSVWATVRWGDGHPVSEKLTALMTATGAPGRVGPAPMRPVAGQVGLISYGEQLPAGTWQVAVDVATPAIGRCEATVRIGGGATPSETRCPADQPSQPAAPAAAAPAPGDNRTFELVGGIAALAVAVAVAVAWWRRRSR